MFPEVSVGAALVEGNEPLPARAAFGNPVGNIAIALVDIGEGVNRDVSRRTQGMAVGVLDGVEKWFHELRRENSQFVHMVFREVLRLNPESADPTEPARLRTPSSVKSDCGRCPEDFGTLVKALDGIEELLEKDTGLVCRF